ncbi:hypothetical protein THAOC_17531 [Thalassiosira oceanica]|uniref:Uncharacterized protein n=1 Tax=Thalassiosira oceanica TaxID=159749 RepID=K0SLQ7_THAOC|nr:hypothetical protein THAOC_17531 [Thalassiosira oceanica]|eukprot:EJK61896.1 hypothetical protein THAOC_17531 [Thalassiosira oceanica]
MGPRTFRGLGLGLDATEMDVKTAYTGWTISWDPWFGRRARNLAEIVGPAGFRYHPQTETYGGLEVTTASRICSACAAADAHYPPLPAAAVPGQMMKGQLSPSGCPLGLSDYPWIVR